MNQQLPYHHILKGKGVGGGRERSGLGDTNAFVLGGPTGTADAGGKKMVGGRPEKSAVESAGGG